MRALSPELLGRKFRLPPQDDRLLILMNIRCCRGRMRSAPSAVIDTNIFFGDRLTVVTRAAGEDVDRAECLSSRLALAARRASPLFRWALIFADGPS